MSEYDDETETPYPPKRGPEAYDTRTPYSIELTREEYHSADYMSARGYLGEITERATRTVWAEDENMVTLCFSEPAMWDVQQVCESDEPAVWALTTPRTTLGEKFLALMNSIV